MKESLIGPIIKKTQLHRGTVYNALNSLIRKGFVSVIKIEKGTLYLPNQQILKDIISNKIKIINEMKLVSKEISKILKISSKKKEQESFNVKVLIGDAGFKMFFRDLYDWAKKTKKEYFFIGRGNEMLRHFGEEYYKGTQELKRKLKIKCRVLLNKIAKREPVAKIVVGNVRYVPWKETSITSTWLYNNKIVIVLWNSKPLKTIIIKDKDAYKSYVSLFEELWKESLRKQTTLPYRHLVNYYEFINEAKNSLDLQGIVCYEVIHEGRSKIIKLLKDKKRVRVLIADPNSREFWKRVLLEERFLLNKNNSRILHEWMAALSNLKDVKARLKYKCNLQIRLYDNKSDKTLIILDNKKILYNKYFDTFGEYGSSAPTFIFDKSNNLVKYNQIKKQFEETWSKAKPIDLSPDTDIESFFDN